MNEIVDSIFSFFTKAFQKAGHFCLGIAKTSSKVTAKAMTAVPKKAYKKVCELPAEQKIAAGAAVAATAALLVFLVVSNEKNKKSIE